MKANNESCMQISRYASTVLSVQNQGGAPGTAGAAGTGGTGVAGAGRAAPGTAPGAAVPRQ
jgi:hypothetical protein